MPRERPAEEARDEVRGGTRQTVDIGGEGVETKRTEVTPVTDVTIRARSNYIENCSARTANVAYVYTNAVEFPVCATAMG